MHLVHRAELVSVRVLRISARLVFDVASALSIPQGRRWSV